MSLIENPDIDDVALAVQEDRPLRPGRYRVSLAVDSVDFHPLILDDPVPLGRQILKKAGINDIDGHSLFVITSEGDFEDVRADEQVDLRDRAAFRFIIFSTDPLYRIAWRYRSCASRHCPRPSTGVMSPTAGLHYLNFRRDVTNGGFGEAAQQQNRTWRMTAEGRSRFPAP
jgi:hypothetical protein